MSVNPTKKTPAPDAGGRGRGGIGRGGRGRSRELPILDHAAVDEDAVEPLTRSPSSSPQVSPTRSHSGREKVGYCCNRRHRREGRKRRTTSLPTTRKRRWSPSWKETKCYGTRRRRFTGDPISKPLHGRSRLKQWTKEVSHLQGLFKGMRDNFARLDKLPKSGSGQWVFKEIELWTLQK